MGYIFMYGIGLKNWNKCIFTEWNWIGITLLVYDWIKLVVYTMEWEFIYKYWYIQMEWDWCWIYMNKLDRNKLNLWMNCYLKGMFSIKLYG